MRSVKLEQAKEVTKLRQEVEQGAKELASKYERKMKVGFVASLPVRVTYVHMASTHSAVCKAVLPMCPMQSYRLGAESLNPFAEACKQWAE